LVVAGEPDFTCAADLALVVVGVRPDTDLAIAAGVQTGVRGRCGVDRQMRTNLPDVLRPSAASWASRSTRSSACMAPTFSTAGCTPRA
jgi:pyridine nucleotide-disulfide oxidoreductase